MYLSSKPLRQHCQWESQSFSESIRQSVSQSNDHLPELWSSMLVFHGWREYSTKAAVIAMMKTMNRILSCRVFTIVPGHMLSSDIGKTRHPLCSHTRIDHTLIWMNTDYCSGWMPGRTNPRMPVQLIYSHILVREGSIYGDLEEYML